MKIYLIELLDKDDWDEYDAVVICTKSGKKAIELAKKHCCNFTNYNIKSKCIGTSNKSEKEGVILSSHNGG